MSDKLAPIVVSVYTRMNHFKQCIEALQNNVLADQSEIFIYSDASARAEDNNLVQEIREYSHNITGFKGVHVLERERNYGAAQNCFVAQWELTKKYGNSITLEDDIVTAPGFLVFMNEALAFYKDDGRILSITGYCPPITTTRSNMNNDVFILPRYCGWGAGIWRDRVEGLPDNIDRHVFESIKNKKQIFSVGGDDVLEMIYREVSGELDAQDVRSMYHQALNDKYTVYPVKSLIQNIGHDGSGEHCGVSERFHHEELWDKEEGFKFVDAIQVDKHILKQNLKFRGRNLKSKVVGFTKSIGIYPLLKKIKNKLE